MQCSHCQEDNPSDARFCMHCGAALPLLCPHCGAERPPEARFCPSCGQPLFEETSAPTPMGVPAEGETSALVGERRVITALFADVKGSTALAERVDVETWVEIMNHVLQVLTAEIHRYGGEVDRYEGDGLVAFFGVPTVHEDDAERAVLAALAMQETVQHYAAELSERDGISLQLRIGLNTGEVIAAHVGDARQHGEDTAMGRAVALAARLEPAAEPGTVLVSEHTYRLVQSLFEWEPVGHISAKGFREPLPVYRPLAHRAVSGKGRGIAGLESPLVDRDAEFRALQDAVEHLRAGTGRIVTLVGEAGIGKSRLVTEVRQTADRRPQTDDRRPQIGDRRPSGRNVDPALRRSQGAGVEPGEGQTSDGDLTWVEGRCLSYASGIAYSLWLDLLRGLLDVAPDAPLGVVRDILRDWLHALCPDCLDDVYPFLGRLLSLPLEEQAEARLRGLEAEGLRVLTFRAVETLVERAAGRQPLVIVCEDLHWADPTSLGLLEHLLPLVDRAPLLLLCVLRPETAHGCWQIREAVARDYPHRHLDLWLKPLSRDEEALLVANLLRVEDLPPTLRERILSYGEGNPFFVEEILRSLIDRGAVAFEEDTGHWLATQDVTEIPIPDTLHGVLASRIDRLPTEAKRVLQVASVIGRIFTYRVLEAVATPPPPAVRGDPKGGEEGLNAHLIALQRAQMIRERARLPEREYVFKHYLTVEAAYGGLLRRERRACHHRVAETLERLYPERVEEQLGLLAHHYEQAGETEQAVEYLQRAGVQAATQYANEEAVSYFSRALDLVPKEDTERRYNLLLARERVYDLHGDREAQHQDLLELREIVEGMSDSRPEAIRCRAEVRLREAYHTAITTGDIAALIAGIQQAIELAESIHDVGIQATGYLHWGTALVSRRCDVAQGKFEQAVTLARAADDLEREADGLRELGLNCWRRGDYAAATNHLTRALQVYREMGRRSGEGRVINVLGLVSMDQGSYDEARQHFERGRRLCQRTGNRFDEAWATLHLGQLGYAQGEYVECMRYYKQALRTVREAGDQLTEAHVLINLGTVYGQLGEYAKARTYCERALRIWPAMNQGHVMAALCWLDYRLGDHDTARQQGERALRMLRESDHRAYQAGAATSLSYALMALGDWAAAAKTWRQALDLRRGFGQHHLAVEPLAGVARVALAQGDLTTASSHVEETLAHLDACPNLHGTLEPLRVYLTCYRVLRAHEDPRATEVLSSAYRLLQERAAKIEDSGLRHSYLENVAAHREIVNEFNKSN